MPARIDARTLGLVVVGGMLGVAVRATLVLPLHDAGGPLVVPAVTLAINVIGSFLLGLVVGRIDDHRPRLRAFLVTGMLGGFTTYSAFAVQVVQLTGEAPVVGLALAAVSIFAGVLAAAVGLRLGGRAGRGLEGPGASGGRGMTGWVLFVVTAAAGGLGAGLRYVIDVLVMHGRRGAFPLGILIVNVTGAFALGFVTGLGGAIGGDVATIIGVGALGGYTTFSTVSGETVLLGRRGRHDWAWANLVGTLVAAGVAAGLGLALGRLVAGWLPS